MLSIWIGRAGSGKSARVLETIQRERENRPQLLLVPEHTSHEAELDLCRFCGPTACRSAEVLTFQSLATRVLGETGGLADVTLDNGGKLLTMRRCLQELHTQLKVFGRPSQRSAFLHQLTTLADEFYAYQIAPETLYHHVEDMEGAMGDKLRDVALIFAAYDAKLRHGGTDTRSRVQKLHDSLPQSHYLDGKDLYLDGFSFFNKQEESVLSLALRRCASVTVTLLGDKTGQQFQNAAAQKERFVRMAREAGVECRLTYLTRQDDSPLGHLERCFFGHDAAWEGETDAVALYQAATAYTEVEYVSAQIRRLAQQGYRYRDMAVAARTLDAYGPLLESIFLRDGIPAYVSRRSDILEKPVMTLLLSAVDAVTGGFEYEDMFRYLKTGMTGVTEAECDLLENYVIRWEIRGNMWLRDVPWTLNPDGYGRDMTEERAARLQEINRIREKVRLPLLALATGLKERPTARDKARTLYEFAAAAGVPEALRDKADALLAAGQVQLAEEYAQLWQIFCGVLDQFVEILADTELDGEEFARLLRLVLTQYSVGTIPATLDQVKVSEITRNDRHRVRILFLLGANDHLLPQIDKDGGVLDSDDRQALAQRDIPLSDATFDALDNELQNIYACLAQPTEHLHISWPVTDVTGAELRPSFVVERVARLFPRTKICREDGAYRLTLPAAALCAAGDDPQLWRYFAQSPRYAAALSAMERARHMERGSLSPEAVRSLYGHSIAMSASRIDRVKSCHFGYFMEYGLRAKERKKAGFEASEIGTFLHYLLENVNRDVKAQGGYGQVADEELRRMVRNYVKRYADECIDDYPHKSARFRYLFSRLRETAYSIILSIAEEMRQSDFAPVSFELSFGGRDGDLPAITVREGGASLSVSGKVDRVDGWLHDGKLYLRVVDYKTGQKSFDLTDIRYGLGIQMLLYLFTLEREGASYFGHPIVPCGVLYQPARSVILRQDRGISDEKLKAALQKELRRTGLVLGEPQILQAMEHSALESPCYLPIGVKKDGCVTGSVATAAQLGHLGRYVDKLLHQIAGEIAGGNIDADPYARGPQDSACTYCAFASACYFDDSRDKRRPLYKTDSDEFWALMERENGEEGHHGR